MKAISSTARRPAAVALVLVALLAALLEVPTRAAVALPNGVADTPPLGWNSYDSFNWNVTESQVRANADYMRDNLRQFG